MAVIARGVARIPQRNHTFTLVPKDHHLELHALRLRLGQHPRR